MITMKDIDREHERQASKAFLKAWTDPEYLKRIVARVNCRPVSTPQTAEQRANAVKRLQCGSSL